MANNSTFGPPFVPPDTPETVPDLHGYQQAQPIEASSIEAERDLLSGYTNPNLDRRITHRDPLPEGVVAVDYTLFIQGGHSYRTTRYITHDEESTTSEIP